MPGRDGPRSLAGGIGRKAVRTEPPGMKRMRIKEKSDKQIPASQARRKLPRKRRTRRKQFFK